MSTAEKSIVGILVVCLGVFGSIALRYNMVNGSLLFAKSWIEQFFNRNTGDDTVIIEKKPELVYTPAWVSPDGLNFRPSPSSNNTPIRVLRRGDMVRVLEVRNDGWARVLNSFNEEGFVDNGLLRY